MQLTILPSQCPTNINKKECNNNYFYRKLTEPKPIRSENFTVQEGQLLQTRSALSKFPEIARKQSPSLHINQPEVHCQFPVMCFLLFAESELLMTIPMNK
jgi:hypothetical protein